MKTKEEIRREVKARMREPYLSLEPSREALNAIFTSKEWESAHDILLYSSLDDECNTEKIIREAQSCGKRVILPVVDGEILRLFVYGGNMKRGAFGIAEPADGAEEIKDYSSISLAIIPGRAFTAEGWRIGRGKGYYDRLLPSLRCPVWGLALPWQIFDKLPVDSWDVRLDRVIY